MTDVIVAVRRHTVCGVRSRFDNLFLFNMMGNLLLFHADSGYRGEGLVVLWSVDGRSVTKHLSHMKTS